ncbi:MAG: sigma-54-dependent Fis family transcriptional regulator [Thermoanaerobaculia bacterium]|nr:sigma-54-dependent Fis family transcriptional regulator [Thermoanaerobaculia bacterium]
MEPLPRPRSTRRPFLQPSRPGTWARAVKEGVLIVEDQAPVARALAILFDVHDIPCEVARTPAEALRRVENGSVGVVIQDMNFRPSDTTGEEGIDLFRAIRRIDPAMPILLVTAWTSLETAVALVREGAADYVAKPWDDVKLLASVRNLLEMRRLQMENQTLRQGSRDSREELARRFDLRGVVYESEAMHRVVSLAVQVAAADVPVLICGPNGAGKEKVAEIIQANSGRRDRPFVRVNAGALPDELLESELFGAEAGAYTGSRKLRIGRFEAADGGTLFLDEIGNLSAAGQVKLLRVLQNHEFERLGSSETRRVDVRVLCATNADLKQAIAEGRFREDLFFRLNVVELTVPPLRERPDDIMPLARSVLRTISPGAEGRLFALTPESERALTAYAWPGNVRELFNRIQRAVLVASAELLTPADLGFETGRLQGARPGESPEAAERASIEEALRRHGGSVSRVAEELGFSRQALYRRMERLGIVLERRPRT